MRPSLSPTAIGLLELAGATESLVIPNAVALAFGRLPAPIVPWICGPACRRRRG
jgi:hypothetical protein